MIPTTTVINIDNLAAPQLRRLAQDLTYRASSPALTRDQNRQAFEARRRIAELRYDKAGAVAEVPDSDQPDGVVLVELRRKANTSTCTGGDAGPGGRAGTCCRSR